MFVLQYESYFKYTFPHFSDALTITYGNQNCSIFKSIILLGFCLKNRLLCTAITTFVQYMLNLYKWLTRRNKIGEIASPVAELYYINL